MYDLLVEELLQESDAEYQTVVQNILDEPVAEETKRRLLSALLLKAYQPISVSAHEIQKKSKHQTRYGVGKIWPFSFDALWTIPISANKVAWHFARTCGWSTTTPLWGLDCRIFRGSLQERKKQDGTVNFLHTFGTASSTSGARGGWFVFVAPRKGVCSKQECAQLEVCNFSKMMVHRESLTQIGLRAEKNVAKHLLAENGWESNLVADVSKVDYLEGH